MRVLMDSTEQVTSVFGEFCHSGNSLVLHRVRLQATALCHGIILTIPNPRHKTNSCPDPRSADGQHAVTEICLTRWLWGSLSRPL